MLILTHFRISQAIMNSLEDESVLIINPVSFRLGCGLADVLWKNPVHYKDQSFTFISALINELQKKKMSGEDRRDRPQFSFQLGLTCHYISDYFCNAHNDPLHDRPLSHFAYENRLRSEFLKYDLNRLCKTAVKSDMHRSDLLLTSLPDYIETRHLAYVSEAPDMKKDVFFALETSALVAAALMDLSYLECRKIAA